MHDIKDIRQNPEKFDNSMIRRGLKACSGQILEQDLLHRANKTTLQELNENANMLAKQIGQAKGKGENADHLLEESKKIKQQISDLKAQIEKAENNEDNQLFNILSALPNILDDDIPNGSAEEDNKEIRKWGDIRQFSFTPKQHFDLGEALGLMDFTQTAKISGSRFVTLKGDLAKLERALSQFMLDVHTKEHGYTEASIPLLVKDEAMFGSGQLPKFAEDSFATTNGYRLIPTSEVSLVNLARETIFEKKQLPIRLTANSPCFRSEAGSAGKDTRGMIRQHQFWKVELVSIVDEESAKLELERMTNCAESILQKLSIPYRVIVKCAGDTGFTAHKTYDIELWLPAQDTYREVSSCSNCGAFQGRRMGARYRNSDKDIKFVHTLNGSGVAVGRCLVAIMENYQNEDGTILVPEVLWGYMGKKVIG